MAQTEKPTKEGYGEAGKLLAGEASSCYKSVVCYEGACAAASEDSTFASPAATKSVKSGFSIVNADTVISMATTVANDTIQVDHEFTAGEDATITGFGVCNDDDDVLFAECCFNAGIALESATSDKLNVQMKVQLKLGS